MYRTLSQERDHARSAWVFNAPNSICMLQIQNAKSRLDCAESWRDPRARTVETPTSYRCRFFFIVCCCRSTSHDSRHRRSRLRRLLNIPAVNRSGSGSWWCRMAAQRTVGLYLFLVRSSSRSKSCNFLLFQVWSSLA